MYDIVFISYNEPNADFNWSTLKSKFPMAKRVHGVKGIHQAHIVAAKQSFTNMIWIVDGDAVITDSFDFGFKADNEEFVYVWRSKNPINDLEYGYGGVKLFPRLATINMDVSKPDMTTSISKHFKPMPDVSNITAFNTDPFNTWKSAFRECTKLSSKIIDRQKEDETNNRLRIWTTVGEDRDYGKYAIMGARSGVKFGSMNKNNLTELKKINDFEWLKQEFDREESNGN
jgi:hypothetical protein